MAMNIPIVISSAFTSHLHYLLSFLRLLFPAWIFIIFAELLFADADKFNFVIAEWSAMASIRPDSVRLLSIKCFNIMAQFEPPSFCSSLVWHPLEQVKCIRAVTAYQFSKYIYRVVDILFCQFHLSILHYFNTIPALDKIRLCCIWHVCGIFH